VNRVSRLQFLRNLFGAYLFALLALACSLAQSAPPERQFEASQAQVEKMLHAMQAELAGRLPTLEGFVVPGDHPLEKYQHGYYQYVVSVKGISTSQASVQVQAKITAWYADENSSKSGYRVLVSNGRLESDLLDRLEEQLHPQAAAPASGQTSTQQATNARPQATDSPKPKAGENIAVLNSQVGSRLPTRDESTAMANEQNDQHLQGLLREEKSLEEILQNQARPNNLVAVKTSQTPVYARPLESSQVLFFADAEDEFQEVEESGLWVHVQISGISRGWIRRSQVELPSELGPVAGTEGNNGEKVLFHQTREETSLFPGSWEALRGKQVKIVWVQPSGMGKADQDSRLSFAKKVFRKEYSGLTKVVPSVAGVVVVFDSQDGGMAAATVATLQQWQAGHLTDEAFWKRCWLDPADAFKER
jgi:hypothetical protein